MSSKAKVGAVALLTIGAIIVASTIARADQLTGASLVDVLVSRLSAMFGPPILDENSTLPTELQDMPSG